MARVIGKLNLNKTPGLVDNNSLVFAKNIKLLRDGTIGRDDGISPINVDFSNISNNLDNKIAELKEEINNYNTIIENLNKFIVSLNSKQIIIDYFSNIVENNSNSIILPDSDNCEESNIYDLYAINTGDGTKENPDTMYGWSDQWSETNSLDFVVDEDGFKRFELKSTEELKTFINTNTLKIPVFPDYFYSYVKANNFTYTTARAKELTDFDITSWLSDVKSIKTTERDWYYSIFTELPDTRKEHKESSYSEWYHQYYTMVYYFNWFLYNHGRYITEQIKAAKNNDNTADIQYQIQYYQNKVDNLTKELDGLSKIKNTVSETETYKIVGVIPYNTLFYLFIYSDIANKSFIVKYDEDTKVTSFCNVNWRWSGGIISGNVFINLKSQTILNIAEYKDDSVYIPFKSINLDTASYELDESVYTQTPKLPMTNLYLDRYYTKQIPNGSYQFFVRYKINDELYTNWIPATTILYSGNSFKKATVGGTISYVDTNLDANKSFVFKVEHLDTTTLLNYKSFQIGFILTHDNEVVARSWKHFSKDTNLIYFDYDKEFIQEIDIDDLININYGIFNIKNITSFKNKLYISNYVETNFNPNFVERAKEVNVSISHIDRTQDYSLNKYSYIYNGVEKNKIVSGYVGSYNGIYFMTTIMDYNDNGDDLAVSDIVQQLFNDSTIKNLLTNGGDKGNVVIASKYGFVLTVEVKHTNSGDYSDLPAYEYRIGGSYGWANDIANLLDNIDGNLFYASSSSGLVVGSALSDYDNSEITLRTKTKRYVFSIKVTFDNTKLDLVTSTNSNITTLIPGQSYKFFIHYVKKTGEITNGYPINNDTVVDIPFTMYQDAIKNHHIIYPEFTNITYPEGYDYCFISIAKIRGFTAELFNLGTKTFTRTGDDGAFTSKYNIAHCIELDTRLITGLSNILCTFIDKNNNVTNTIGNNYYPSYDAGNPLFMGGTGFLTLNVENVSNISRGFVTLEDTINEDELSLIKCTPIINKNSYNIYNHCNLLGFICDITKPVTSSDGAIDWYDSHYVSGNDIYSKQFYNQNNSIYPELLEETDIPRNNKNVPSFVVYSNYNLNYLSLALTLKDTFKSSTINGVTKHYVLCAIQSLEVSDLYKLESMYKEITQKRYIQYQEKSINKFDNTVRSSNVLGDESVNNIYKFAPTDYYNVPTTKGVIVNMIAIGNAIIIHTEDSMFKFTGNNTLSTSGGEEISMQETDVFDTGIIEVFGSEFGYAGLQDKFETIVLPDAYVFYDSDAKEIYAYSGQGQISKISDPIDKLLKFRPISKILFAGDYFNNRIFIHIEFVGNYSATLSYNFAAKSFVSLHDFTYEKAFNTKVKSYFIKDNNIYVIDDTVIGYDALELIDDTADCLYPSIVINDRNAAIVDIIVNQNIETVKTLNAVNWVVSNILSYGYNQDGSYYYDDVDDSTKHVAGWKKSGSRRAPRFISDDTLSLLNLNNLLMAEETQDKQYAGNKLRIYTDLCATGLMDISNVANNHSISNVDSYRYPRFNQGYWSFNYFRDIRNIEDIFKYIPDSDRDSIYERRTNGYPQTSSNLIDKKYSDNNALIEGRYFVIRFIFDIYKNFKLEHVTLNIDNKL